MTAHDRTRQRRASRDLLGLCLLLTMTAAILSAPATPAAPPAAKRGFTIEDLYRLQSPSGARLSPDGRQVVYALEMRDLARGKSNRDLYLVSVDGGEPRRLTWTEAASESSPIWSPDGKSIAFVATRDKDAAQLWLLPVDGGEARAITEIEAGVDAPVFSPDGRFIAFVSEVWPECGADRECNRKRDTMQEKNPLTAYLADELLYRHWNSWKRGKVSHVLAVEIETKKVTDLTPGEREAPVFSLGGGDVDVSPDGQEIAFTRNPDPVETLAQSTNSDIFVAPTAAGPDGKPQPAKNITAGNPAWDGAPRYSPDGRYIAYRRQLIPGYESDLFKLVVYDRKTGTNRVLTPAFDNWVTDHAWLPDSTGLVFRADVEGRTPLFVVGLDGSAPREVARFAQLDEVEVAPGGKSAIVVRRSVGEPSEIWRLDLTGTSKPVRMTRHNAALEAEVDIRPAEELWIPGAGGRKIHTFVVKPHGFDPAKKYPLVVNIHGGPQMQWADAFRGDWQIYPGAGVIVAFPNPHGSTGYGQAFTEAISGDWGGKVMEDIRLVTEHLAALPYVDRERLGAMGWSWGGYAMFWLLGQETPYKAFASMMGAFDLASKYGATEELWFPEWELKGTPWNSDQYEKWTPAKNAARWKTPTLIVTGEKDYRIAYTESLQAFTALRRQGVPARLVVLPNAGHWPGWYEMALYYTAHQDWFHRWLGGDPPPWSAEDFVAGRVFDPETGKRREN